jgi:plasmid stabilization system protein ParE
LFDAATSLRDAPRKGRPLGKIYRELIVRFGKSAYIIRYRIEDSKQTVFVVRIWHGRERRR